MNYTRLQIKKLEEHRKFLNKEIERFHVEIKECLDKEAAERQAKIDAENERLRLEQEAKLEQERKAKAKAKKEKQKQKKTAMLK
ncbi:hypothetical protein DOY81_006368 [Sarcophaga bullata]|nr:hypothetical protein DOY81_006368 [Sarcophaga bullata]